MFYPLPYDLNEVAETYNRITASVSDSEKNIVEMNFTDYETLQPFMESMVTTKYENPDFTFEVRGRCIEVAKEIIRYSDGEVRYKLRFKDFQDRLVQMCRLGVFIQRTYDFFHNMEDEYGT